MTQHDYKAALTEFERIISTHPDYAGATIHDDHPVALISRSIRIADKLMQEPSEEAEHAGTKEAHKWIDPLAWYDNELASQVFKSVRDKMLEGVE